MSCYLLFLSPEAAQRHIYHECPPFTLSYPSFPFQQEDALIPVRRGSRPVVLPYLFSIEATNRAAGNITVKYQATLNHALPLSDLNLSDYNSGTGNHLQITKDRFDAAIKQMGGLRMNEEDLLNKIEEYITAQGFYFSQETLRNYHICLKTRPFVILAGLSGTGKSKLSRLYAEALGHKPHYRRLPVRPNWNDDRYVLGYFNTITNTYMTAPAIDFLLDANNDEENIYFFCLDEMNLAHVEHYFSQFLSAMEEEPGERSIPLLSRSERVYLSTNGSDSSSLPEHVLSTGTVQIPSNFFVTGTVNVDETTHPISDKVMDRANILEFFQVELDKVPPRRELSVPVLLSASTWRSYQTTETDDRYRSQILAIGTILNKADLGLGYRVIREIELYLANSRNLLAPQVAFDLQVKQRILPRVRGSEAIGEMLRELHKYLVAQNLPISVARLEEMQRRLGRDGYTSFWR